MSTTTERSPTPPTGAPNALLASGVMAPDFTLQSTPDRTHTLADYRGHPVVLAFYPADWSPVCGDQMALYNEMGDEFAAARAQLFGVSVDGAWCHLAYADSRRLHFPLLADFEPKGEVSRRYGAYNYKAGRSARALYVIDAAGTIRWSELSPDGVNPGAEGIFAALDALTPDQRGTARPPGRS
jgi:peroxiredoxin